MQLLLSFIIDFVNVNVTLFLELQLLQQELQLSFTLNLLLVLYKLYNRKYNRGILQVKIPLLEIIKFPRINSLGDW